MLKHCRPADEEVSECQAVGEETSLEPEALLSERDLDNEGA